LKERLAMHTPPIVSAQEWEAARQKLLVKEKALSHARDALAAERRRMPWLAVEKKYEFDGPLAAATDGAQPPPQFDPLRDSLARDEARAIYAPEGSRAVRSSSTSSRLRTWR
jgi:hypothetical protein